LKFIIPNWPAPDIIRAYTTTRFGGFSASPFDTLNLSEFVGDDLRHVTQNREQLIRHLNCEMPFWLKQMHGTVVLNADENGSNIADASYSRCSGTVCAVLSADCVPILICSQDGSCVAAVHAGWKGLASGVIEATLSALKIPSDQLLIWLGPAISKSSFCVGEEVFTRFMKQSNVYRDAFEQIDTQLWLADLKFIAKQRLQACGIESIYCNHDCTYRDVDNFFSFRRDQITGRMASLIWIDPCPS
jgi:polyphenol oxidase